MANRLIGQPSPQFLVSVVAGVVADDVDTGFVGMGGQQLLVQPLGALRIDAGSFVEQYRRGPVGVNGWEAGQQGGPIDASRGHGGVGQAPHFGAGQVAVGQGAGMKRREAMGSPYSTSKPVGTWLLSS